MVRLSFTFTHAAWQPTFGLPACLCTGLEVRLTLPALFELPKRVTPGGATLDGANRLLSWRVGASPSPVAQHPLGTAQLGAPLTLEAFIGSAERGAREGQCVVAFSAVFLVPAGELAARGALRATGAEVVLQGQAGHTLTGVTLRQHGFVGSAGVAVSQAMCRWHATVQAFIA